MLHALEAQLSAAIPRGVNFASYFRTQRVNLIDCVTPIEAHSLGKIHPKTRTSVATMASVTQEVQYVLLY